MNHYQFLKKFVSVNHSDKLRIEILTCQSKCPQDSKYNKDSKLHVYQFHEKNSKTN